MATKSQLEFIARFAPHAQEVMRKHPGVRASITLSQLIQEAGWNLSTPKDVHTGQESYNLFGIKGTGPAGYVLSPTWEVYATRAQVPQGAWNITQLESGKWRCNVYAKFRAYRSYAESLEDHAAFLLKYTRYIPVLNAKDAYEAADALQKAGYATDPNYAKQLKALIKSFNLDQYDVLPPVQSQEEEDEDNMPMKQPDWFWNQAYNMVGKAYNEFKGTDKEISWSWCQKILDRTLTAAEYTHILAVIDHRRRGIDIDAETPAMTPPEERKKQSK